MNKILIINEYHKQLTFPTLGISIDTKEIKEVTEEQKEELLKNKFIKEVLSKKETTKVEKVKKSKSK